MRAIVLSLLLLGVALAAVAAPAPLPRRAKPQPSLFEGEWKMTRMDDRDETRLSLTVQIRGNRMKFVIDEGGGQSGELDAEFSVRPGPQPAPIDLRLLQRRRRGQTTPETEVVLGTYQIEGDVLRLSLGRKARPTGIDDKAAERYVFTRVRR